MALENTRNFHDLDSTVQRIITELTQNPRSFDELKVLIQAENALVKGQITNGLQEHQKQLAHEQYCQRFLETLAYPEIHRRQEIVREAYHKTFTWVYEPNAVGGSAHRCDSISQWLERGNCIYWISGKAGSGKSTLMNYISQDSRSQDLLKVWSGTKEVFTPKFFFWNAGTFLEKSTEGLLRSVLYQILNRFPELTPHAYDERSAFSSADDGHRTFGQTLAWTERRLLKAFHNLMPQVQKECRICIFIDGLDEIGSESDAAIEVVKSMLSADLKVCLSSRPDLAYADAFDSCPKLRLQDLTELDIRTYSRDRLQPYLQINTQGGVSEIVDGIAKRAQGVFLWVELVVKAMIKGLKNHDSVKQLRTRVDSTPSDIEALYAQMLSKVEVAYREEAAQLFHMALAGLSHSLLNVALALSNGFNRGSEMSIQEALHLCYRTQRRVPTISAGLLEVYLEDRDSEKRGGRVNPHDTLVTLLYRYANSPEKADISFYERYAHVDFIHRTAMDFFRQSKQGQLFLTEYTISGFSAHSSYVKASLAKVNLLGFPEEPPDARPSFNAKFGYRCGIRVDDQSCDFTDLVAGGFIFEIMQIITWEEWLNSTAQRSLCDDVNRTLAAVYKRNANLSQLSHWSARWGRSNRQANIFIGGFLWSRRTSRSGFPGSFDTTRSEPTLRWNTPFDFLGFAASWGLYFYVLEMFDSQQKHLDEEYASHLICCSLWGLLSWGTRSWGQEVGSATLNLMTELLRRGGNPNMHAGHLPNTIWGLLLGHLPRVAFHAPSAFTQTMRAFLESGANIHIKAPISVVGLENQQSQAMPESLRRIGMYFRHERSALYVVRSWLKRIPELKSVEKIILAKGGKETHAFTHIALRNEGYRPRKLSQRRQLKLNVALDEADHGYPNKWNRSSSTTGSMIWEEQLGKIYKEISETGSDSESSASSDGDDPSDDGAEEDFFEPMDLPNLEDMQE